MTNPATVSAAPPPSTTTAASTAAPPATGPQQPPAGIGGVPNQPLPSTAITAVTPTPPPDPDTKIINLTEALNSTNNKSDALFSALSIVLTEVIRKDSALDNIAAQNILAHIFKHKYNALDRENKTDFAKRTQALYIDIVSQEPQNAKETQHPLYKQEKFVKRVLKATENFTKILSAKKLGKQFKSNVQQNPTKFFGGIVLIIAGAAVTGASFGAAAPIGFALIATGSASTLGGSVSSEVSTENKLQAE